MKIDVGSDGVITNNSDSIAVLMATYNGAQYLGEQLDSLFAQECQQFNVYVHDDGSTDTTLSILSSYQLKYPGRIHIMSDPNPGRGAKGSFIWLMENVEADHYMFCDQDDVWLPQKISLSLAKLREMESKWGKEMPLMVHTDLELVDAELHTIHPSFWEYGGYNPDMMRRFGYCAVSNVFTGCTMMFNRAARDRSVPAHPKAPMHDWWLALVVTKYGHADNVKRQLVKYRQHGNNAESAGAPDRVVRSFGKLLHLMDKYKRNREMLRSLGYGYVKAFYYKLRYTIYRAFGI